MDVTRQAKNFQKACSVPGRINFGVNKIYDSADPFVARRQRCRDDRKQL